MKKLDTIAYTLGIIFYSSAILFAVYIYLEVLTARLVEPKDFTEIDEAAEEVVDGLEDLRLAVELDLKALEEKYDG